MKILVTGATGTVGSAVAAALVGTDYQTVALGRFVLPVRALPLRRNAHRSVWQARVAGAAQSAIWGHLVRPGSATPLGP